MCVAVILIPALAVIFHLRPGVLKPQQPSWSGRGSCRGRGSLMRWTLKTSWCPFRRTLQRKLAHWNLFSRTKSQRLHLGLNISRPRDQTLEKVDISIKAIHKFSICNQTFVLALTTINILSCLEKVCFILQWIICHSGQIPQSSLRL